MSNQHGEFIWYELLARDLDEAQRFYSDVIGWTAAPSGMPGMDYHILTPPDGVAVGGLMKMPEGMPGGPVWLGYVAVDDVDEAAASIVAGGGSVQMPAMDIGGVGRIAMMADPAGAPFYIMRPLSEGESGAFQPADRATPGHVVWNELSTPDPDRAIAFYTHRFGWRQEGAMPMGDLGEYRFLLHGATPIGAVMGEVPGGRPGWQFYFRVEDVDAAVERLGRAGGRLVQGPDQIPGGDYAVVAADPQGARFGLVGPRR